MQHQLILTLLTQGWLLVQCEFGVREKLPEPIFAIAKKHFSGPRDGHGFLGKGLRGTQHSSRSAENSFYKGGDWVPEVTQAGSSFHSFSKYLLDIYLCRYWSRCGGALVNKTDVVSTFRTPPSITQPYRLRHQLGTATALGCRKAVFMKLFWLKPTITKTLNISFQGMKNIYVYRYRIYMYMTKKWIPV